MAQTDETEAKPCGQPAVVVEVSPPYRDADGVSRQAIVSRHSDGFVCLRLEDARDAGDASPSDPSESVWTRPCKF